MVKKLIALISTEGKSEEQLFQEVQGALKKYKRVEEKVFREKIEKKKLEQKEWVEKDSFIS